jgi:hypothetical protein
MGIKRYKAGDKVNFTFLGENLKGTIQSIRKEKPTGSEHKIKYWIFDGKYKYPTAYENIKSKVK